MGASPPADGPFDRALRRLRRARAAAGSGGDWLLRRMAEELIERLDLVTRSFSDALVLGAEAGLGGLLREQGLAVTVSDADEDRLPFGPQSFDLIVSAGSLDTVNDLPGALIQIRRALRPDGLFLAAFLGAGSAPLLRRAMRAAEEAEGLPPSPRLHPQIDVHAAGDLLTRAGFALPVADREGVSVRYSAFQTLVADLRAIGATNILAARDLRPFGRRGLAAARADFEAEGGTVERFEIVHMMGWAPGPDQPKAAARGSGSVSLADALKSRG
ncbi:MAG: methyltransferase domain-containing protein [Sphingomonadaceae bacterium]|nr:methyltransferase domain-containing protein [Sphingomonadaceae bacterium]